MFIGSFVLSLPCDFLHLICSFFVCGAWPCHFVCSVIFLSFFHGFLLNCFSFLFFMFCGLGNWLGKRKVSGAQEELNETKK